MKFETQYYKVESLILSALGNKIFFLEGLWKASGNLLWCFWEAFGAFLEPFMVLGSICGPSGAFPRGSGTLPEGFWVKLLHFLQFKIQNFKVESLIFSVYEKNALYNLKFKVCNWKSWNLKCTNLKFKFRNFSAPGNFPFWKLLGTFWSASVKLFWDLSAAFHGWFRGPLPKDSGQTLNFTVLHSIESLIPLQPSRTLSGSLLGTPLEPFWWFS